MLKSPLELAAKSGSHGVRPHGYSVEFSTDVRSGEFGNPAGPWQAREVMLERVELGYGSESYKATFRMWDADSVEAPHIVGMDRNIYLQPPKLGEIVCITVFDDDEAKDGLVIFKGPIKSVHDKKTDNGIQWVCEAVSDGTRLDDQHVTFSANLRNDPLNPSPRFDGEGYMMEAKLRTVAELVKMIMDFPDAWGREQYWTYDDIDWQGLDTSPRCGLFTPSNVIFDDAKKGQAIRQVLEQAGNYTFMFKPDRDGNDRLVVVELNLACDRCGLKWDIPFASPYKKDQILDSQYASEFVVEDDSTVWSAEQTANVCRVTGGMIQFYSGHYIVPEILENYSSTKGAFSYTVDADSMHVLPDDVSPTNKYNNVAAQRKRATSFEDSYYRFSLPNNPVDDKRKKKQYFVGLPMFPDWNPHEDYIPHLIRIAGVKFQGAAPPKPGGGTTDSTYFTGLVEWSHRIVGDLIAQGSTMTGKVNNLRMYQAWFCKDACPACNGSGSVEAVYSGFDNEPEIELVAINAQGQEEVLTGNFSVGNDERVEVRVKNYIFDPKKFGEKDPSTGQLWPHVGLQPWSTSSTQPYPIPWKNLCPYCRGVGLKPEHKIRNIRGELFSGRNNQLENKQTGNVDVPLDPDATSTGPETWEQIQNRLALKEGPMIQVEAEVLNYFYPDYSLRNKHFDVIKKEAQALKDANPTLNLHPDEFWFPHPLRLKNTKKILQTRFGVSDGTEKLAPDSWHCVVPRTTIVMDSPVPYSIDNQLGKVIFSQPIFIPCEKQYMTYVLPDNTDIHEVLTNGTLATRPQAHKTSGPNRHMDGYWRPSRVWMTYFYGRDNYYNTMWKKPDGTDLDPVTVQYTTADGQDETYIVRPMVLDGRYCMEIIKEFPDSEVEGGMEFATGNRLMQDAIADDNSIIQTFEEDLWSMPVVPDPNDKPEELEEEKKTALLHYPRGRVLRWEAATQGEKQREMDGYGSYDFLTNPLRPKLFSWRMRDDRPRLLQLGIKKLEAANNLHVSGSMTLVGMANPLTSGLGWVDYPDRARAAVKRLTYDFTRGYKAVLELTRERARMGELPPDDETLQNQILKDLTEMKRIVYNPDGSVNPRLTAQGKHANHPQHKGKAIGNGSGSTGHARFFIRR